MINKNQKILFLGGAFSQLPAIEYAIRSHYYVITLDYLPNNPGHSISHEYHNISTIEKEEILKLSKKIKIDAICAYASDPAAETAAYVSEELGIIGGSYESVQKLSNKKEFRCFLKNNNFNVPWFFSTSNLDELIKNYKGGKTILKPVDSSGSKGVFTVKNPDELIKFFEESKSYSRTGQVILEEQIERKGPQIHGEGFVVNGELSFILLGDQFFSQVNPLVPYSTVVPSIFHHDLKNKLIKIVQEVIKKIGFKTGGINVELIRDINDEIFVLEIGARNGGNYMPQLMYNSTGLDLAKVNVDALLILNYQIKSFKLRADFYAQVILHSSKKGKLKKINIPSLFENSILEKHIYYKIGDNINIYKSSKDVVGVVILKVKDENFSSYFSFLKTHDWVIVD